MYLEGKITGAKARAHLQQRAALETLGISYQPCPLLALLSLIFFTKLSLKDVTIPFKVHLFALPLAG